MTAQLTQCRNNSLIFQSCFSHQTNAQNEAIPSMDFSVTTQLCLSCINNTAKKTREEKTLDKQFFFNSKHLLHKIIFHHKINRQNDFEVVHIAYVKDGKGTLFLLFYYFSILCIEVV